MNLSKNRASVLGRSQMFMTIVAEDNGDACNGKPQISATPALLTVASHQYCTITNIVLGVNTMYPCSVRQRSYL